MTAPWDYQTFFMAPAPPRPRTGLSTNSAAGQLRAAVANGGSWASVAATAVEKNSNGPIKFTPSDSLIKKYEPEVLPEDMRVVWIQGWTPGRPLGQITQYVTQGPICSMAYSPAHQAVCIVFQHASSAQSLLDACLLYEEESKECLFGHGCSIITGQPYPMNEDLQRMNAPWHERRRLTFARSQMFSHGMTEAVFRNDIFEMVGESNVELVWLFNTGNGQCPPCTPPVSANNDSNCGLLVVQYCKHSPRELPREIQNEGQSLLQYPRHLLSRPVREADEPHQPD